MQKLYLHNIRKIDKQGIRAAADLTVGNAITLRDVYLAEGKKGFFVGVPSQKYEKDGKDKYSSAFYVKSEDTRKELLSTFLAAYEKGQKYAYSNGEVNPEFNVEVRSTKNNQNSLKAWAKLNINDEFVVNSIAVRETEKGFIVNFPSDRYFDKETGEEKYKKLVVPEKAEWEKDGEKHSKDYGKIVRGMIINEYKQLKPSLDAQIDAADKAHGDSSTEKEPSTQKDTHAHEDTEPER